MNTATPAADTLLYLNGVSVGGRGTLSGAIVGAALVNLAKTWLTGAAPETWLFVLGALLS